MPLRRRLVSQNDSSLERLEGRRADTGRRLFGVETEHEEKVVYRTRDKNSVYKCCQVHAKA